MLQDIRIAFRFFRRAPAPTAIALLSIALSVGATAVAAPSVTVASAATITTISPRFLSLKSFPARARYEGVSTTVCTISVVLHWTPAVKDNRMPLDTNRLRPGSVAQNATRTGHPPTPGYCHSHAITVPGRYALQYLWSRR